MTLNITISSTRKSFYLYESCQVVVVSAAALGPLSADPPGELDVLGHDGDPLGVDGAKVGVFEEPDEVGLSRLLEGHDGGLWNLRSVLKSWAISLTRRWKGSLRMRSSVDFW